MFTRSKIAIPCAVVLLLLVGFVAGFRTCLHARDTYPPLSRAQELAQPGNAPPSVRTAIVERLHVFQQGYTRRDPNQIDAFARDLFPSDDDILILGTEGGTEEWVRGRAASRKFVADDWRGWAICILTSIALLWGRRIRPPGWQPSAASIGKRGSARFGSPPYSRVRETAGSSGRCTFNGMTKTPRPRTFFAHAPTWAFCPAHTTEHE